MTFQAGIYQTPQVRGTAIIKIADGKFAVPEYAVLTFNPSSNDCSMVNAEGSQFAGVTLSTVFDPANDAKTHPRHMTVMTHGTTILRLESGNDVKIGDPLFISANGKVTPKYMVNATPIARCLEPVNKHAIAVYAVIDRTACAHDHRIVCTEHDGTRHVLYEKLCIGPKTADKYSEVEITDDTAPLQVSGRKLFDRTLYEGESADARMARTRHISMMDTIGQLIPMSVPIQKRL